MGFIPPKKDPIHDFLQDNRKQKRKKRIPPMRFSTTTRIPHPSMPFSQNNSIHPCLSFPFSKKQKRIPSMPFSKKGFYLCLSKKQKGFYPCLSPRIKFIHPCLAFLQKAYRIPCMPFPIKTGFHPPF